MRALHHPPFTPHRDAHPFKPKTSFSPVGMTTSQPFCPDFRRHAAPLRLEPERKAQVAQTAPDSSPALPVLRREQNIRTNGTTTILFPIQFHRKTRGGSDSTHHLLSTPDPTPNQPTAPLPQGLPTFSVTLSEVFPICLVRQPNRVQITFCLDWQTSLPTIAYLNTGAGAKLILYEAIPSPWYTLIPDRPDPGLCGANGTKV